MTSYTYIRTEPYLWTVGYYDPASNWQPESDHGSPDEAELRADELNGNGGGFVYMRTEPGLWTVGWYDHTGKWMPEADFGSKADAAAWVIEENGGAA